MNREADRCTFHVVPSEDDDGYVGTAVEFPALSHHSATAQDALAGIQQLVADALDRRGTDEEPQPRSAEKHYPVPCLVCGKTMEASPVNAVQPRSGVIAHIFSQHGSEACDPQEDATWLQAALCDNCLRTAIGAARVLHGWRSRASTPPPRYRTATSDDTIGFLDDPHLM